MNEYLITCLIGYVLGCFNTAYVIGKIKGFDIRDTGSGNAGASNIKIALGWKFGAIVAFVDILKCVNSALTSLATFLSSSFSISFPPFITTFDLREMQVLQKSLRPLH